MSVELHRDGSEFEIWFEYRSDLYKEETIRQIRAGKMDLGGPHEQERIT